MLSMLALLPPKLSIMSQPEGTVRFYVEFYRKPET